MLRIAMHTSSFDPGERDSYSPHGGEKEFHSPSSNAEGRLAPRGGVPNDGADRLRGERVAEIAERQAAHPFSGGGEDGVAERRRQRRESGFPHAGRRIVR